VTVTEPKSEFPIYKRWNSNPSDPVPVFERCELLHPLWFGEGCFLPAGTKCRLDVALVDRIKIRYEDDAQNPDQTIRIFKISPKKLKITAAEVANRVGVMWAKLYPDTPAAAT
jgi:hypothetical protein